VAPRGKSSEAMNSFPKGIADRRIFTNVQVAARHLMDQRPLKNVLDIGLLYANNLARC
jgi:hypothetical protein